MEERVLALTGTITDLNLNTKIIKSKEILILLITVLIDKNEFSEQKNFLFLKSYIDKTPENFKAGERVVIHTPASGFIDNNSELPIYKIERLF